MRSIPTEERRARLVRRQLLCSGTPAEVSNQLVGFHATDPMTAFLSANARTGASIADIEHAMYVERSLVRILVMRGTIFTMPPELAAIAFVACTSKIAPKARTRMLKILERTEVTGDRDAWLADVEARTVAAVVAAGEALGSELAQAVPELQTTFEAAPGKPYNSTVRLTSRLLDLLASQGHIVRGRPRGSVTSSQYRWAPMSRWIEGGLPQIERADAVASLVARWLGTYGPGTVDDVKWWTGLTKTEVRKALVAVGAVQVQLEDGAGYVLSDDVDPVEPVAGGALLLPSLDPTPMGWSERGWFGGTRGNRYYDRSGNICPTVWWDGRIVGAWVQRRSDGRIVFDLEDVGAEARVAIDEAAHRTAGFLGDIVVKPRFPSALDKALAKG